MYCTISSLTGMTAQKRQEKLLGARADCTVIKWLHASDCDEILSSSRNIRFGSPCCSSRLVLKSMIRTLKFAIYFSAKYR